MKRSPQAQAPTPIREICISVFPNGNFCDDGEFNVLVSLFLFKVV
jgi:hypothetical protein